MPLGGILMLFFTPKEAATIFTLPIIVVLCIVGAILLQISTKMVVKSENQNSEKIDTAKLDSEKLTRRNQ